MLETYFGLKFWEEIIGWIIVGVIVVATIFSYSVSTLIEFISKRRKQRQYNIAHKKENNNEKYRKS